MFIRGLNTEDQVNIAWKERYINTRAAEQPATYDDIIEDIRSYTLQRITFGVSSVPNQKGSTKDGNVQAYAAGAGQSNNGSSGKGQQKYGKNEHDTNPSKPKEKCWNCGALDCRRGKNCKKGKSSYCKTCNGLNWHRTENHEAWTTRRDQQKQRRAD
ncbi:unnamed protein product [Sphagnum jensenii]|uniref:Uncharacterized protein n=1 Tax=Sphagnum jensenii TaxID=128206 RepID=A0ABP1A184_9BRYO